MDNKITRTRLGDFFSYEWVRIIIFSLVAIFVWELVFTITGVTLTTGQQFKVLYDTNLDTSTEEDIIPLAYEDGAFSYDVQKIDREFLASQSSINILSVRYETRDCDVIATCNKEQTVAGSLVRQAYDIIDSVFVWSYDEMIKDGEAYLLPLLKSEFRGDASKVYDYENLDEGEINKLFSSRKKNDNRFRTEKDKQIGMKEERARIKKLCLDLKKAKYLLENHLDIFLNYTRFEYTVGKNPVQSNLDVLENQKQKNLTNYGKEKLAYGIDLEKLTITGNPDGKYNVTSFFSKDGSAEEIILMAFNFINYQPHLQFESLSFMNSVVHLCSNLLDGFYA